MSRQHINVTEALRVFAAGRSDIYTSLAYAGNAVQMARSGIVYTITHEDAKNLHDFATDLLMIARFQQAGLSVEPEPLDKPESMDGTAPLDQHMR